MEKPPDHAVFEKNVLEMITVTNDFCITLKKAEQLQRDQLVDYLVRVFPLMYLKGTLLPKIEVRNPDRNERFFTEEEWESLFNEVRKKFGKKDAFWFYDPEHSDEPVKGSIAEHIADIYQDLQDFLTLYQVNSIDAKENAVHELQSLFYNNWGIKTLRLLFPLHALFQDGRSYDQS
jgi:hypothetical protein